jgi:hypothetical protein
MVALRAIRASLTVSVAVAVAVFIAAAVERSAVHVPRQARSVMLRRVSLYWGVAEASSC